ncbi:transcriptional coactivator/pterin dehydratase [Aspergillus keveii]|uniref:4a-hydroxytetrahydrobiopterin dehydratase n=1 Tax=Aspergillus keveii TaxID=714993 RepID=A0ABR4FR58_9EURO
MTVALRGCLHLPKSLFSLRPMRIGCYLALQLHAPVQHRTLRTSAFPKLYSQAQLSHGTFARRASTMASEPQFADGIDPEQLRPSLNALQSNGWSLDEDKIGIKKTYYFKSYFKAVSFVNVIASQSATKKHHATMTIRFGSVDIHWTTHHPRGLTDKDTSMAQFCDQAAELVGVVEQGQGLKCGPGA